MGKRRRFSPFVLILGALTLVAADFVTREEQNSAGDQVADSLAGTVFTNAADLLAAARGKLLELFGVPNEAFTTIDEDILLETVQSELDSINEVDTQLTDAERAALQAELDGFLLEKFNGHSFENVYRYSILNTLAEKHLSKKKDEAARLFYERSLEEISDVESIVFNQLCSMSKLDLRANGAAPSPAEVSAAAQTLNRFTTYFPTPSEKFEKRRNLLLALLYYKHFPQLLAYDSFDTASFTAAVAHAERINELKPTTRNQYRIERIQRWELGSLALTIADSDNLPLTAEVTLINTSPNDTFCRSEDRDSDVRIFTVTGQLTIPVYKGHEYSIVVTAKPSGSEKYATDPIAFSGNDGQLTVTLDASLSPHSKFVAIDTDFEISKAEVPNADFIDFLNASEASGSISVSGNSVTMNGYRLATANESGITYDATQPIASRFLVEIADKWKPTACVSWYGAAAFCNWKSENHSLAPAYASDFSLIESADGYRLPTESQWFHAAAFDPAANVYRYYANGRDLISPTAANFLNSNDPYEPNALKSSPIINYEPIKSPLGLYDASGNLWEWQQNSWNSSQAKIARGGSWANISADISTDTKTAFKPETCIPTLGFRIVRNLTE